jgi:release factor glutamine methyltransferase
MTLRDSLLEASAIISRRDAEVLLAHTLHRDRAWLLAHAEDVLAAPDLESFRALVARRAALAPLQHLTGMQEFFGLTLRVTTDVLIPRPETEHLVEAVLNWAHAQSNADPESGSRLHIADVGTGSGAIAIALASVLEHASITAIDISPAALAIALENAERHHLAGRIRFLQGDLLTPLFARQTPSDPLYTADPLNSLATGFDPFDPVLSAAAPLNPAFTSPLLDAIVSNPPYVATTDAPTLAPEVRDHEPALALYAGADGLDIYRRLIPQAFDLLRSGGLLAMEIGFGQRQPLAELLTDWKDVQFLDDYASIPRVVLATHP